MNLHVEFIFYIFLNKICKIYWSEQSFTGLGPEDQIPDADHEDCLNVTKLTGMGTYWLIGFLKDLKKHDMIAATFVYTVKPV